MYSRLVAPWLEVKGAIQPMSTMLFQLHVAQRQAPRRLLTLFPENAIKQCEGAQAPRVFVERVKEGSSHG